MNTKHFVLLALLLLGGWVGDLQAQNLNRAKELLREMQGELDRLEARQKELEAKEQKRLADSTANAKAADFFPEEVLDQNSIEEMHQQEQHRVASVAPVKEGEAIDTLASANEAIRIILYNDNTWRYVRDREICKDNEIFSRYWDTVNLFPYKEVPLDKFPASMAIDLVDSLRSYHYPYKGTIKSYGKFGPRRRRPHRGIDLTLQTGDPIYATFSGRVRISRYNTGGYGNLVVIRHDNGLETYYGHLSKRMVVADQWVEAGQVIGLGGSTGRSTGPHLHYETRYYGQTFDPERLIDFESGDLRRETIVLKKFYFDIHSNAGQDFEEEIALEEEIKREAAEQAAMKWHTIKSGDTLGALARKYGTTVTKICQLNGIKSTTTLRIGRKLRVR
jgi:murein DD-endopeptidase MepM/ murein hydrolase activator NlpD